VADIPFKLRFIQFDKRSSGALKRDFGTYFESFWKKWMSMIKNQAKRDSHIFRRDMMKIAPSAVMPLAVTGFRLIGIAVEPLISLFTSSLGPIISLTFAQIDKQFLEHLSDEEMWINKHRPILEPVMDLYASNQLPSDSEKDKYWKEWEQVSLDMGKKGVK